MTNIFTGFSVFIFLSLLSFTCNNQQKSVTIYLSENSTPLETLAAREVRRYIYLRTGNLLPLQHSVNADNTQSDLILVASKDNKILRELADAGLRKKLSQIEGEQYILKTITESGRKITLICGGNELGTLYASYRFAESLGVRFYLHGDVIPDQKSSFDLQLDEAGKPLFSIRGIQPFHDFPEGPDWWSRDDYKVILSQLAKLRMNFIGFHTYPEGPVGPEPLVWIGVAQDLEKNGAVRSSYPSRHFTTMNGTWGYQARPTGDYYFGMDRLFDKDFYGNEYMEGMSPFPKDMAANNTLFRRTGIFFREIFSYARSLKIRICAGTETPLIVPEEVRKRLGYTDRPHIKFNEKKALYKGMFDWITKNYPLDYYWFWTPENWTWGGNSAQEIKEVEEDLRAAIDAAKEIQAPFNLATSGWVLGPKTDRTLFDKYLPENMAMSCINRQVGFAPVDNNFARLGQRPRWAIPWLEDDPAMIIPQLWAGRMRRDAADALAYGCTGLIGIHWRTRILGPNISALARAAWDQNAWNPNQNERYLPVDLTQIEGSPGALYTVFTDSIISAKNDENIFRNLIFSMDNFYLNLENGLYEVTLQFLEVHYKAENKRLFKISIQDNTVIDKLDIFARAGYGKPLNLTFENLKVTDGRLKIHFDRIKDNPILAGIVISKRDLNDGEETIVRKINCAGQEYNGYESDPSLALQGFDKPRDYPVEDFYSDWALSQFGENAAEQMAEIFIRLDGSSMVKNIGPRKANLPRPSDWRNGPGGLFADKRPWTEAQEDFNFIDQIEEIRYKVTGKGNLERFDYWLNNFRYLRAVSRFNCILYQFDKSLDRVKMEKNREKQKVMARDLVLPIRIKQIEVLKEIHTYLQSTIQTKGSLGTVANWQQHNIPVHIEKPGEELAKLLGDVLPADAVPDREYQGEPRLIVPTVRSSLNAGESYELKVIAAGIDTAEIILFWRPLGKEAFQKVHADKLARSVYRITLPGTLIHNDFEYYIEMKTAAQQSTIFPVTAPGMNQTVIIL